MTSNGHALHPFFDANASMYSASGLISQKLMALGQPQQQARTDEVESEDELAGPADLYDGSNDTSKKRKRKAKAVESAASKNAMYSFLGVAKPAVQAVEPVQCESKSETRKTKPRKKARLSEDEPNIISSAQEAGPGIVPVVESCPQDAKEDEPAFQDHQSDERVTEADSVKNQVDVIPSEHVTDDKEIMPRNMLKLDGQGGFGALSKTKRAEASEAVVLEPQSRPKRTKKRKGLVVLRYGKTTLSVRMELGKRINHILSQPVVPKAPLVEEKEAEPPTKKPSPRKTRKTKNTHPFFTGDAKRDRAATPPRKVNTQQGQPSPGSFKSFTTPGKLRSQMQRSHNLAQDESTNARVAPVSRIFSLPGTHHALFPPKGFVHIGQETVKTPSETSIDKQHRPRKRKNGLHTPQDLFPKPIPSDGRSCYQPDRCLFSAVKLQNEVEKRLQPESLKHPMLKRLYNSISTTMSPFDVGAYESQAWAQKYAPQTAAEVLTSGKDPIALKEWLESQTTAFAQTNARSAEEAKARQKRKRKRKKEGLDDFIVDSDDDVEMRSIDEDELGLDGPRSMVRGVDPTKQASNVVLLCGPHGSGKSATVYAVAKELGFDVFEINSSSRRSGKDIIEKVGDMSLNHQVRRERAPSATRSLDGNVSDLDLTLPLEPDEKQSSLTAFFGASKTAVVPKAKMPSKKEAEQQQVLMKLKAKASEKKQSLILIEEADILFEEDRGFWETIIMLATQSKRPIILTCTDETLIPQEDLSLHAILRFRIPPTDLVTDYLLLIAALEGHLLREKTLESLYQSRRDLRGTIYDLQFWCQMAVGDPRGGADWYLQRWPPGSDRDSKGHTKRVVSKDTYLPTLNSIDKEPEADEHILVKGWRDMNINPVSYAAQAIVEYASDIRHPSSQVCSQMYDILSSLDTCTGLDLPNPDLVDDSLDMEQPYITRKAALDYTFGYKLLHKAVAGVDYEQFDTELMAFTSVTILKHLKSQNPAPKTASTEILFRQFDFDFVASVTQPILPKANPAATRAQLNTALEPLMHSTKAASPATRDFTSTILDTAPYIRSIISYDLALERERELLTSSSSNNNNLLNLPASQQSAGDTSGGEGSSQGRPPKRARTTRAARSALEGNARAITRRERWFEGLKRDEDMERVLRTAGSGWAAAQGGGNSAMVAGGNIAAAGPQGGTGEEMHEEMSMG